MSQQEKAYLTLVGHIKEGEHVKQRYVGRLTNKLPLFVPYGVITQRADGQRPAESRSHMHIGRSGRGGIQRDSLIDGVHLSHGLLILREGACGTVSIT